MHKPANVMHLCYVVLSYPRSNHHGGIYRMDWTDVHYRQLARLISKHTWLWTEMVVDKTVLHTTVLDK